MRTSIDSVLNSADLILQNKKNRKKKVMNSIDETASIPTKVTRSKIFLYE